MSKLQKNPFSQYGLFSRQRELQLFGVLVGVIEGVFVGVLVGDTDGISVGLFVGRAMIGVFVAMGDGMVEAEG